MDHGTRHPDMAKKASNVYILTCNVSMEYEKSEGRRIGSVRLLRDAQAWSTALTAPFHSLHFS